VCSCYISGCVVTYWVYVDIVQF